jgi:hypothetical protein
MLSRKTGVWVGVGLLGLGLGFGGCGGGSSTSPSSTIPNLVGDFSGTWTQELAVDGQSALTQACSCTLTIPNQTGNIFYGRSTLAAPCDQQGFLAAGQGRGGVLSISDGRIESGGTLSFRFSEDPRAGLSGGGCTVTAMPAFSGTYAGSRISAERTEAYDCTVADGHRYTLTIRLAANR